jgi:hypothetical protein
MFQKKSAQCIQLMELFKGLHLCEADQIVVVLHKTRKGNGAFVAADTEVRREYHWDGNELQIMMPGESRLLTTPVALTAIGFNAKPLDQKTTSKSNKTGKSEP